MNALTIYCARARTLTLALALLALLFAPGCLVRESLGNCEVSPVPATCDACIARPGCGFCRTSAGDFSCLQGGALGPAGYGECEGGLWSFRTCSESAPLPPESACEARTDCSRCSNTNGCGWCIASNRCMRGSFAGPFEATCASGWVPEYVSSGSGTAPSCTDVGCPLQRDCLSCVRFRSSSSSSSACTWCGGATGRCQESGYCGSGVPEAQSTAECAAGAGG